MARAVRPGRDRSRGELLADLAGAGAALELGIGTGRIAIPLSQRGVPVHGIDLSPQMVYQLQAKPGCDEIGGRVETYSKPHRYLWPSELDLMARLAGMSLRERWGDWTHAPFTSDSTSHVSVWEKPA